MGNFLTLYLCFNSICTSMLVKERSKNTMNYKKKKNSGSITQLHKLLCVVLKTRLNWLSNHSLTMVNMYST